MNREERHDSGPAVFSTTDRMDETGYRAAGVTDSQRAVMRFRKFPNACAGHFGKHSVPGIFTDQRNFYGERLQWFARLSIAQSGVLRGFAVVHGVH